MSVTQLLQFNTIEKVLVEINKLVLYPLQKKSYMNNETKYRGKTKLRRYSQVSLNRLIQLEEEYRINNEYQTVLRKC